MNRKLLTKVIQRQRVNTSFYLENYPAGIYILHKKVKKSGALE
ncbi:MAG: hypothetical protein AB8G86_20535 [Saprospiraceae bacterium]